MDATLHVTKEMGPPLYGTKPERDWFWLGQSLDKQKALIVKENYSGPLGEIIDRYKIWDNDDDNNKGNDVAPPLN